jgi:hypothetical protein
VSPNNHSKKTHKTKIQVFEEKKRFLKNSAEVANKNEEQQTQSKVVD